MFYKLTAAVRRNRKWFIMLAGIIVFVTTYALILPAITIDKDTAIDEPGLEAVLQDEETTLGEEESTPEETEPPDETETSEPELPAVTLEETAGDVSVKVEAEEGVFPADTTMILNEVDDKDSISSIEDAVEDTVKQVQAVEVAFQNADGETVEPQDKFTMTVEPAKTDEDASQVVVTLDEEGKTEIAEPKKNDTVELLILPEEVPVVAVVQTQELHTTLLTASGKTYEATVTFDETAGIPEGSTLLLTEFKEKTPAFENAKQLVIDAGILNPEPAESTAEEETNGLLDSTAFQPMSIGGGLTGAKNSADSEAEAETGFDAFDLAIFDNHGNEIEPAGPVQVELTVKSLPDDMTPEEFQDSVTVTHLRETGEGIQTEVVAQNGNGTPGTVEVEKDSAVMAFETDSFSVYTVTWTYRSNNRTYYRSSNIHYGYMNGSRFVEFPNGTPGNNVINIDSDNSPAFLIYDVAGYQFDSAHLDSATGTEIEPLIRYYNSRWQYIQEGANPSNSDNWHNIAYSSSTNANQDIYMVYKAMDPVTTGGHAKLYETAADTPNEPAVLKESENNHDGTRTLSLSVTGDTRPIEAEKLADIIVIFDNSGSMNNNMAGGTATTANPSRLSEAKKATNYLAEDLLNRLNRDGEKLCRMALVTFSNTAEAIPVPWSSEYFTDDPDVYESMLADVEAGGGTNWEQALQVANRLEVDPERETFVVFVTDGDPTWRMTRSPTSEASTDEELLKTSTAERDMYSSSTYQYYRLYNVFGMGNSDNKGKNYAAAVTESASIVSHNKQYFSIGISNDVTNLENLMEDCGAGADHAFLAAEEDDLMKAINTLRESIEGTLGWGDVEVVDGITGMTNLFANAPIVGVDGESFVYEKSTDGGATWVEFDPIEEGMENPAVYEDGMVQWHMGESFQLAKGTTYRVSFVVWPSQEALDICTDLNNGLLSYNDLSEEQRAQIKDSGDVYTLETNTEDAYVEYKESRVTGNNVEVGDTIFTKDFGTVQPLLLQTMELKIEKLWKDDFGDGEDRAEEVHLLLEARPKGSDEPWTPYELPYIDPTGNQAVSSDIWLSDANEWTASGYISPGLIDGDGNIRDPGYEFRLSEPGIDYHYELNYEIINPVLHGHYTDVPGTDPDLESHGVYITKEYLDPEGNVEDALTAVNVVKGGINIGKIVYDHTGQHEIFPDETFTIRGKILDPDGNPYTFNMDWDDREDKSSRNGGPDWLLHQNDPLVYHTYDKNGNRTGYKLHFASTDNIELHLKAGETVRFPVIPADCTFELYEVVDGMQDYDLVRIDAEHSEKNEAGVFVRTEDEKQPQVSGDNIVTGVIYGNSKHDVTFYNQSTVEHYDIQLLKVDVGNTEKRLNGAQFELYKDEAHTQKAKDINGNEVGTITTEGWLDEEQTQPAGIGHIGALPNGTYYLVETVAPNGYFELTDHIVITVSNGGVDVLQTDNAQGSAGEATHYEGQGLVTFTVTNTSGKELPHTGGPGTLLYTSGGLFLMAAAMIYLICVRRRERRLE